MTYLIDGYNLIFSLVNSKKSLQTLRNQTILALQKEFLRRHLTGTIVFDGTHRREEESGISYSSPLKVAYAPRGQSADEYIVELVEISTHPKLITVVTNDKGLTRQVKSVGASTIQTYEFISWLHKKRKKKKVVEPKETKENFDRLLKIFEDKLKDL